MTNKEIQKALIKDIDKAIRETNRLRDRLLKLKGIIKGMERNKILGADAGKA